MLDRIGEQTGELKRRKRELIIICSLLILIPIVLYYVSKFLRWNIELSVKHKILVFTVININTILILLLLYLILRNLVKLFLQSKRGILGSKLRLKLVVAFMILSLFPTCILFIASVQYIGSSVDYWFSRQIDKAIKDANEMASDFRRLYLKNMIDEIQNIMKIRDSLKVDKVLNEVYSSPETMVINQEHGEILQIEARNKSNINLKDIVEYLQDFGCLNSDRCTSGFAEFQEEGVMFVLERIEDSRVLLFAKDFPKELSKNISNVSLAYIQYSNLDSFRLPIKSGYIISLGIVSLLVLFVSMWFGVYMSKEITVPIQALAEATRRISAGDYDFLIEIKSKDEIGILVNSFNRMTREIKSTKEKIDLANQELKERNQELIKQNQYIEFVINNIGAGVLSTDSDGVISTFNIAASRILNINGKAPVGMPFEQVLPQALSDMIYKELSKKNSFRRQVKFLEEGRWMNLLVTVNKMFDEKGNSLGFVAVFEDLTEVEKAERMEAWQEVARRIAHEVKNPLTPIQLSAQRLKKRLFPVLGPQEAQVLSDCTELILSQVDELKRLVGEFSMFARMPKSVKVPFQLEQLLAEIVELFKERHRDVKWDLDLPQNSLVINGDREQLRRAITNLLNNAVEAVGRGGSVFLRAWSSDNKVMISVEDSGPGIPLEDRHKVFEPYFSTKPQGGGLGLAITHSIVKEHGGEISIESSRFGGAQILIQLPLGPAC